LSRGVKPDISRVTMKKRASTGQPSKRLAKKKKADLIDINSSGDEAEEDKRMSKITGKGMMVDILVLKC